MAIHALSKTVNYDAEVWSTSNKGKYRIYDIHISVGQS